MFKKHSKFDVFTLILKLKSLWCLNMGFFFSQNVTSMKIKKFVKEPFYFQPKNAWLRILRSAQLITGFKDTIGDKIFIFHFNVLNELLVYFE